jgi:3-deoxy-D-manno-octulosonate 8-phosphate phosphatase (KDO 8-P phosphatase)
MKSLDSARWKRIKLFAMDVDGILTDGTVCICSNGLESKSFSIQDGLGLRLVLGAGIGVAWISGRHSDATTVRARELEIPHLFQGSGEKRDILRRLAAELNLEADEVCYMGDDVVDLQALDWAGVAISVPNGIPEVMAKADHITRQRGGFGAVREICNFLLQARQS